MAVYKSAPYFIYWSVTSNCYNNVCFIFVLIGYFMTVSAMLGINDFTIKFIFIQMFFNQGRNYIFFPTPEMGLIMKTIFCFCSIYSTVYFTVIQESVIVCLDNGFQRIEYFIFQTFILQ